MNSKHDFGTNSTDTCYTDIDNTSTYNKIKIHCNNDNNLNQSDIDCIYSLYSTPSLKTDRIMEIYLVLSRIKDKNSIEYSLFLLELNILKQMREKQELELFHFKMKKRNIEEKIYFENLFK